MMKYNNNNKKKNVLPFDPYGDAWVAVCTQIVRNDVFFQSRTPEHKCLGPQRCAFIKNFDGQSGQRGVSASCGKMHCYLFEFSLKPKTQRPKTHHLNLPCYEPRANQSQKTAIKRREFIAHSIVAD